MRAVLLSLFVFTAEQVVFGCPDLTVSKTGPAFARVGDVITYTLTYKNLSGIKATNFNLVDVLPAEVSALTNTLGSGSLAGNVITWKLGPLSVGSSGKIVFKVQVTPIAVAGQYLTNRAQVGPTPDEIITNNNSAKAITQIVGLAPLTNQLVCEGGTAVFSTCVVGGSAPFAYQWYKGTSLLSGKTSNTLVLTNVSASSAGTYSVVATSCGLSLTNSATLDVEAPAVIVTPHANLSVCPGETAAFSVGATGAGLEYRWFKDDTLLVGRTNATLTLEAVSALDEGVYRVVVRGRCGIEVASFASLSINPLTIVIVPPADLAVCPGSSAVFQVVALGFRLGYQWYHDGVLLPGETNNILTRTNVQSADEGVYSVVVNGRCGSTVTNSAALTLLSPVTVTTPPADQTLCEGETAVFAVEASGSGLTFQWYHGASLIAGQTGNSLILTNVNTEAAGLYTVVVSGACGRGATNSATLTVNPLVALIDPPVDQSVAVGDDVEFTVTASGTDLRYEWIFEGQVIGTESRLLLNQVNTNQSGTYCVLVSGACGDSLTNCATLTVNVPVEIILPPANQSCCPGGNAQFSVSAAGTGLSYQWWYETNLLAGRTNDVLTLTNVGLADAGLYRVVVDGAAGGPVTNSATLLVIDEVIVATPPADQSACVGGAAVFAVDAQGAGLRYQWYRAGNLLSNKTNSILTLTNLTEADAAIYTVVVGGECGVAVTNSATLAVNLPVQATPLLSQTNCPGATAVFSTVASGTGPFAYEWSRDGVVLEGELGSSLVINNVQAGLAGAYTVVVSGACGNVSRTANLVVNTPVSATPLTSQTNCAGTTAVFSTAASGSGPFSYLWFKNNAPLPQPGNTLELPAVTVNDTGIYRVIVSGACGSVTNEASLVVIPGTAASPLANQARNPGQTASFSTVASGIGPFTYVWRKNDTVIPGQSGSSLVLSNVTTNDEALYTVEVTGACGTASQSASLHINRPPTVSIISPTNGATFFAPASFTIAADAFDSDGTVTNVEFFSGTNRLGQSSVGNPFAIIATNLLPGTYTLVATAVDDGGLDATSTPVSVQVLVRPSITSTGAIRLNLQTGLFEQKVRVSNPTYSTYDAVRIYVHGVTNPVTVYNPSGVTNGVPYVQSSQAVPPGSYVDLTIEYYVPVGGLVPNPTLLAELVPPAQGGGGVALGFPQPVTRGVMLADRTFMVEFLTVSNRFYQVEYSGDLKTWKSVQPPVTGNGTSIQWIDNGQPKTESDPADQAARFYRVVLLP